jgi:hypothetical protein
MSDATKRDDGELDALASVPDELRPHLRVPADSEMDDLWTRLGAAAPDAGVRLRIEQLRVELANIGVYILMACEPGRPRSVALTKLEEVGMWGTRAIMEDAL